MIKDYPVYEVREQLFRGEGESRRAVFDEVLLTCQRPYARETATATDTPMNNGEPVAVVEVDSPQTGTVTYLGEGGQSGQGIDFGGPHGPGGVRRQDGRGLVSDALAGLPGYRLVSGDPDYLDCYCLTRPTRTPPGA